MAPVARTRIISHSALFLAIAVLLPVGFHTFGLAGRIFLPMHIPVLLAGFLAGPWSGLVVGLLAPTLSYLLTGMPPTYAVPLMSMELAIYGFVAGITYNRLRLNIYIALILAMLLGRLMFAVGLIGLGLFMELPYTAAQFIAGGGALWSGLPGIMIQLVLVPVVVAAVNRGRHSE
ncbi:MAG: ECF transporter S component [candidate division Zixibacteria bacterium]|nr:ECF transporter S component [candidate division Zixibacteria bacterium]